MFAIEMQRASQNGLVIDWQDGRKELFADETRRITEGERTDLHKDLNSINNGNKNSASSSWGRSCPSGRRRRRGIEENVRNALGL